MPDELSAQDAGLFFLTRGISEHGCSPTKIGEYWAMGLPVITTPNVSDTDEIVRRDGVGVVVEGHDPEQYEQALSQLEGLLRQPGLSEKCRTAAEGHYSLRIACERQVALYRRLLDRAGASGP
jgi:glycosyltransferase involved in cell wall biosynthesis